MDPLTEKQRDAARVYVCYVVFIVMFLFLPFYFLFLRPDFEFWNSANVSVWEFTEVEKQGVASPQQPDRVVKPNDVYTIMYTSGTTGKERKREWENGKA